MLIGWKSQHGRYDINLKKKQTKERNGKREIIIKYIIKNSQNKGFSAMITGGVPEPPPPTFLTGGGGGAPASPPVPTPMWECMCASCRVCVCVLH